VLAHRLPILALALVCATAAVSVPRAARAADTAEANRHFQLGVELYDEGKFEEALIEFERAYEIAPHPLVLYNLAGTHRELSHYGAAIEYYERFLKEGEGAVGADLLARGKQELAALRARVGTIEVTVDREGAEISVDGRKVGDAPLARPLVLGPGRYTITVGMPGGRVETRVVTLASRQEAKVDITLGPDRVPGGGGGGGGEGDGGVVRRVELGGRVAASVSAATNVAHIGDTGAAVVGLSVRAGSRLTFGVDVVTVAWAVVPSLRVRLLGQGLSLHAIAAAPIAFTDGDTSETFVAGAFGLGLRYFATPRVALRAEALVSIAGSDHGTTVPVFAGVELWF
jgi:hypothetical protein